MCVGEDLLQCAILRSSHLHVVLDLGDLRLDAGDGLLERRVDGVLALVPDEPGEVGVDGEGAGIDRSRSSICLQIFCDTPSMKMLDCNAPTDRLVRSGGERGNKM